MQRIVNQEEARVAWGLNHWYEKSMYVVGIVFTVLFIAAFTIGYIDEVVNPTQDNTSTIQE